MSTFFTKRLEVTIENDDSSLLFIPWKREGEKIIHGPRIRLYSWNISKYINLRQCGHFCQNAPGDAGETICCSCLAVFHKHFHDKCYLCELRGV